jgi:hypothetical protein
METRVSEAQKGVSASDQRVGITPTAVWTTKNIVATSETAVTVAQKRVSVAPAVVGKVYEIAKGSLYGREAYERLILGRAPSANNAI